MREKLDRNHKKRRQNTDMQCCTVWIRDMDHHEKRRYKNTGRIRNVNMEKNIENQLDVTNEEAIGATERAEIGGRDRDVITKSDVITKVFSSRSKLRLENNFKFDVVGEGKQLKLLSHREASD